MPRFAMAMGCIGLLVLSAVYCLPNHPSAGNAATSDAIVHVALFAAIGGWFGWFAGLRARVFIALGLLAALLEVAQWRIAGFPHVEWHDVFANEVGLALSLVGLWLRTRWRRVAVSGDEAAGSTDVR
ncbi:hypothetical protein [Cognatiluteimonas profundi]|uniref:hypothetical protein n=1 Tax=Cognatiluteimonas profundi TaxID=2594501 RepID=UPI00131C19A5|nr:hypothetical protein [Lysobacter profundi]